MPDLSASAAISSSSTRRTNFLSWGLRRSLQIAGCILSSFSPMSGGLPLGLKARGVLTSMPLVARASNLARSAW